MRYLAIDLGAKRTGLAAGDDVLRIVQPVEVLMVSRGPALMDALAKAIDRHGPDALVIGLPINMDGTEGAAVTDARVRLPVHFHDERLSSFEADQRMSQSGRTHREKKELRDALAACAILEAYLAR